MLPAWRKASTQRSSTLLDVTVVAMFMALSSPTRTSIGLASCSVQCGLAASERPSVLRLGSADFKKGSRLENRSEEHTSELQSLMRISYAVLCLKKKRNN